MFRKPLYKTIAAISAALLLPSAAEAAGAEKASKDIYAMDTYMQVTAYGEHAEEAVEAAEGEIKRLDAMLSTGRSTSEVSYINAHAAGEAVQLSQEAAALLEESLEVSAETDGAFDITVYPLMELWGFTSGEYRVPDDDEIAETLRHVGSGLIEYDGGYISFADELTHIDFGAIAKGFTSGRIMDVYREAGVTSGLVSLGGNVQALGTKTDGTKWKIGIQNPEKDGTYLGIIEVADRAVITSGGYERYFEEDGKVYHHILDPSTGRPSDSGLKSVTIVSENGMLADALSTALFVMGAERAEAFWREHRDDFEMVLLTKEGKLLVSEGLRGSFSTEFEAEWVMG